MTKGVLPFLLLLILSVKLNGQSLLAHRYSMANGLPSNEVFSILKDKRGFMWIGTDRGLCKFDGETFQLFTTKDGLAENSTLEIKEDKFGRIWARSYSGLFSVLNKDSIWTLKINADITSLVIGNRLYQFELDDSMNLYLGERVYGNIYKSSFPYNSIQQIISPNTVIKYLQISDSKSLVSYTMNKVTSSGIRTVALILKNKTIQFPLQMKTAQLNFFLRYFTQSNEYVFSADNYLNTYNFLTNKINTKIFPFRISAMEVLSDSTYLVGGFKGELAIVNKKKDNFKLIDKFSSSISKILYHHNTCWITTLKNGIYYIPNIHYNIIHENTEPLISIMPIAKDSVLVLNANSEADIIGKNTKSRLPNSNNFKTLMYWQHFDQSQQEYIAPVGCFNYIINKKNKQKIYYNIDKKSNWKQTEFVVPMDGKIYVAYYGAVHVYMDGLSVAEYKLPFKDRATVMFGNKKTLFVGSLHGLLKIANQQIVPLDTHAFLQNKITAIDKIDENNLVIATPNNGIGIYNLQNKKLKIFYKSYGLDKLTIEHVFVDEEKKIWIATKTSIHVLKNVQGNAPILLDVTDLMLNDLSIKEIRCLNKVVYIIAGNKVITIQEPFIKFNMNVFSLVLNSVFINGKSYNLPSLDTIILKANQNNLLLKYQLLTYLNNQQIEYRYKLNDDDWLYTNANQLQLASLAGGKYKLTLQGRLKNGLWSNAQKINFRITKVIYKTTGFIVLTILASLISIYLLLSYYFKNKYKKRLQEFELKRELESARLMASKSQMNPHFIFNALNSIQNFIIKSDKMQAYQYLNDFSALIRSYSQYSNKDYIKLDKELELMNTYIKIEQLRIPFLFDVQLADTIHIKDENVFTLLLQPILENAIWHGLNHQVGNKKLNLSINKKNNRIEINVTDNGIGRQQSKIINAERISKPASVATDNMNSRIASLKLLHKNEIKVKILDNFDAYNQACGTTVLISFDTIYEKN